MNQVEYNKERNYKVSVVKFHLIYAFYFLKITFPKWSFCIVVHSHKHDWKLIIT